MSVNCRKYLPKIKQDIYYIKLVELFTQYPLIPKISFHDHIRFILYYYLNIVTFRVHKNVKINFKHITIMKIISLYIDRISLYFLPNKMVPRDSSVRVHKW